MAKKKEITQSTEEQITNSLMDSTIGPESDETVVEFTMDDSEDEAPAVVKGTEPQKERTELEGACYTYLKSLSLHDFALHSKFGEAETLLKKF